MPLLQKSAYVRKRQNFQNKLKETNKLFKKYQFFTKKIETVLYLLDKCLKMKVHKMLERQTNVYAPTFM